MSLTDGHDPTAQPDLDGNLCPEWMAFRVSLKALSPEDGNASQYTLVERIQLGEDVLGELVDEECDA